MVNPNCLTQLQNLASTRKIVNPLIEKIGRKHSLILARHSVPWILHNADRRATLFQQGLIHEATTGFQRMAVACIWPVP